VQLSRQNQGELVYSLTEFWLPQLKGTLMRQYRQLIEKDRIDIYAMKQAGKQQNQIATTLAVHPSTISHYDIIQLWPEE